MTESEVLELVRNHLVADGLAWADYHITPRFYPAGSFHAQLSPWPDENIWWVSVEHDLIHRGLITSGGSLVFINCRTGEIDWSRLP